MIKHPCYVDKTGGNPSDLVSVDTTQIVYCEFIAYDQGMKKLVCSIFVLLSLRDYTPKKSPNPLLGIPDTTTSDRQDGT